MLTKFATGGLGGRRRGTILLAMLFLAICLGPYANRLRHPSLYTDDVARVAKLQTAPLGALLFWAVNEHMAPLFQAISWATWRLAGESLVNAPTAFTLASYLPFLITLGLLGRLVRRELGSATTALVAVAAFSLSGLHNEAIYWFSASSFMWALLWTLVAWLGVASAVEGKSSWAWFGSALACLLAPSCSAIGLLAGPSAFLRGMSVSRGATSERGRLRVVFPLAGTLTYLGICSAFRYNAVLMSSLERHADPGAGLLATARASIGVLIPGLFGVHPLVHRVSPVVALGLFAVGVGAALFWARRSADRPLILGGLALIVWGYGLTFSVRADQAITLQRYQLFPQLGLVLLLSAALHRWLGRYDARPMVGLVVATALASLLLLAHRTDIRRRGDFYQFRDQGPTLAALEHLGQVGRRERITRDQALAALDPIRRNWFPFDPNVLNLMEMLPRMAGSSVRPDPSVRPTLLAALSPVEREAICGGMDVSKYGRPGAGLGRPTSEIVGHLVRSFGVREVGVDRYRTNGWPSYREYEFPEAEAKRIEDEVLSVPGGAPGETIELWWADRPGGWSETRCIRWRIDPARPVPGRGIVLGEVPHWGATEARRIRLVFRSAGPIDVGEPRLFRSVPVPAVTVGRIKGDPTCLRPR